MEIKFTSRWWYRLSVSDVGWRGRAQDSREKERIELKGNIHGKHVIRKKTLLLSALIALIVFSSLS